MKRYPLLTINHEALRGNMNILMGWCKDAGIDIAGVIKGANGLESVALDFEACGAKWIASSRLEQLKRAKDAGVKLPMMLIRIPMLTELDEMVQVCDYSLQSEFATLKALETAAIKADKVHNVVLMADLGDLREGFFEKDELVDVAKYVEDKLDGVHLAGIGTNLGCYGSVMPTEENMTQLVEYAEAVEAAIGRKLEIISGGATTSLMPVFDKVMPERVNMLRVGAAVLCGPQDDIRTCYGYEEVDEMSDEAFTLEAEVIEVKRKPSHPIGKLGVNAFGEKQKYVDRGMRQRALLAVGREDFGDIGDIVPELEGAEVIGASGDHAILDVEDCKTSVRVGDVVKLHLDYTAVLRLTASENVRIDEIDRLYGIQI